MEEKSVMDMNPQEFQKWKKDQRKINDINDINMIGLRLQHEYEKLMYEMAHYRLQSKKDFLEMESIKEEFDKVQELVKARIDSNMVVESPSLIK